MNIIYKITSFIFDITVGPIYEFILNHFVWFPIEGQLFRSGDKTIVIQWNGKYNANTSMVSGIEEPRLFRKFDGIRHGTVFVCEYQWKAPGMLKNVRNIVEIIDGAELESGTAKMPEFVSHETYPRNDISFYESNLRNFGDVISGKYK